MGASASSPFQLSICGKLTSRQFMMDYELKLEKPQKRTAWIESLVMGISYFLGRLQCTTGSAAMTC